jgi:hypothetical protein
MGGASGTICPRKLPRPLPRLSSKSTGIDRRSPAYVSRAPHDLLGHGRKHTVDEFPGRPGHDAESGADMTRDSGGGPRSSAHSRFHQAAAAAALRRRPSVHEPYIVRFQFDPWVTARSRLATVLWLEGYPDQAVSTTRQGVEEALAGLVACGRPLLPGRSTDQARRPVGGLDMPRATIDELAKTPFHTRYDQFLGELADALSRVGRVAEGVATVDLALDRAKQNGGLWYVAELLRIKGEIVLRAGALNAAAAAQDLFAQAID